MSLPAGFDPYAVLSVRNDCSEKELKNAYRLQCLKWHPDKNLDNKEEAQKRFIAAREAFEFLFDKTKRAEYDANKTKIRVREEKYRQRMEQADDERRKKIEELNRREKAAEESTVKSKLSEQQEARQRKREEERIREEMRKIREELEKQAMDEIRQTEERIRKAHAEHRAAQKIIQEEAHLAKLKLKFEAPDEENDYSEEALRIIYEPYGKISAMSLIKKKKGKRLCVVEFAKGVNAWGAELEEGVGDGPKITGEWIVPPSEFQTEPEERQENKNDDDIDYDSMSLEELEAHALGSNAEKKARVE
ncbi:hypothetical protein WR25_21659 [Diploscapter pachys]|uniref:J domain-containing protein n=1 Tax=Diploscapter pachys TaxID=2018661 RepID=A0A2A2LC09_9BILA|nr:hypothetical protein WR25_21659 [Diploscapter pachys]